MWNVFLDVNQKQRTGSLSTRDHKWPGHTACVSTVCAPQNHLLFILAPTLCIWHLANFYFVTHAVLNNNTQWKWFVDSCIDILPAFHCRFNVYICRKCHKKYKTSGEEQYFSMCSLSLSLPGVCGFTCACVCFFKKSFKMSELMISLRTILRGL